jgi:hypothetical protein
MTCPDAREITLRKRKRFAPDFHRHIAKSRLEGHTCAVGDVVIVYTVVDTVPEGRVAVTGDTVINFE